MSDCNENIQFGKVKAGSAGSVEPQLDDFLIFKGWYSSGYLPHFDSGQVIQSVTFRLADSLPQEKLLQFEQEVAHLPDTDQDRERRKKMEMWLDAGIGCCALKHPALAKVVEDTFFRFDGERYQLIAWCIMPNHVHVLIEPKVPLLKIVQSWKSFTGRWAMEKNVELGLDIPGKKLWMREYWDRFIRNEQHLQQAIDYIHENPVKAGLTANAANWPWSSAHPGNADLHPGNAEPQLRIKRNREWCSFHSFSQLCRNSLRGLVGRNAWMISRGA